MKGFPWRPRMAMRRTNGVDTVIEVATAADGIVWLCWATDAQGVIDGSEPPPVAGHDPWGWVRASDVAPVDDDPATIGVLLGVVRDVHHAPGAQVTPYVRWDSLGDPVIEEWMVCLNDADDSMFRRHPTEFAALLAAYRESP